MPSRAWKRAGSSLPWWRHCFKRLRERPRGGSVTGRSLHRWGRPGSRRPALWWLLVWYLNRRHRVVDRRRLLRWWQTRLPESCWWTLYRRGVVPHRRVPVPIRSHVPWRILGVIGPMCLCRPHRHMLEHCIGTDPGTGKENGCVVPNDSVALHMESNGYISAGTSNPCAIEQVPNPARWKEHGWSRWPVRWSGQRSRIRIGQRRIRRLQRNDEARPMRKRRGPIRRFGLLDRGRHARRCARRRDSGCRSRCRWRGIRSWMCQFRVLSLWNAIAGISP